MNEYYNYKILFNLDPVLSFSKISTKVSKNGLKKSAKLDDTSFIQIALVYDPNYKSCCITASDAPRILIDEKIRKLSIKECINLTL